MAREGGWHLLALSLLEKVARTKRGASHFHLLLRLRGCFLRRIETRRLALARCAYEEDPLHLPRCHTCRGSRQVPATPSPILDRAQVPGMRVRNNFPIRGPVVSEGSLGSTPEGSWLLAGAFCPWKEFDAHHHRPRPRMGCGGREFSAFHPGAVAGQDHIQTRKLFSSRSSVPGRPTHAWALISTSTRLST